MPVAVVKASVRAALLVALAAVASQALAASRAAIPLVPAPAGRISATTLEALCIKLVPSCTASSTRALVASGAPAGRLYLLDSAKPWLAMLDERDPADSSRARVFDLSSRRHSTPPAADGGDAPPLHLHPALYPVGIDGLAVAIVSTTREMYSGGGASFDVADFVELDASAPTPASAPRALYVGVPFACSKTVRACFSEKEYRRSPHCTDDSTGHLTIALDGDGSATPRWSFRWHELGWPAHAGRASQRWTRESFVVPAGPREVAPGAAGELAMFCGGPVS